MNTIDKIKKSWWVILSLILFLNGFGFIYIGAKHNNKNWILEGVMYELPWFFYFIMFGIYGTPIGLNASGSVLFIAVMLQLVSFVRSIWIAVKLADVYDNTEKYKIQTSNLNNASQAKDNGNGKSAFACCLCIVVIIFIFVVIAL